MNVRTYAATVRRVLAQLAADRRAVEQHRATAFVQAEINLHRPDQRGDFCRRRVHFVCGERL